MRWRWLLFPLGCVFLLVVSAARAQDIYVTPIPSAPFSGTINVERTILTPNGSSLNFKTVRGIGRDSAGRIYTERRALLPVATNVEPALMGVHLYDPQTRVSTMLDTQHRTYSTFIVRRPPPTEPPGLDFASPAGSGKAPNPYTQEVDLGTRVMMSLSVHGVREIQTIPADASGSGKAVTVTDDYWYSPDLHMNLALQHQDPRSGTVTMIVTQLTLAEPDPARFQIPEGYQKTSSQGRAVPPGQPSTQPQPPAATTPPQ